MPPFQNVYDWSLGQKVMRLNIKFEVSYYGFLFLDILLRSQVRVHRCLITAAILMTHSWTCTVQEICIFNISFRIATPFYFTYLSITYLKSILYVTVFNL